MYKAIKISFMALVIALLTACTSSTAQYQAAGEKGFGYSDKQLAKDMYWVSYKSRDTSAQKATDYALLRAAELTLAQGYEWFVVSEKDVSGKRLARNEQTEVHVDTIADCTSDMCGSVPATRKYGSDGVNIKQEERADFTVELTVLFGKGERPEPKFVYDAEAVIQAQKSAKN
ncbi:CC0125/CC1285 family lipoprotein [Pseudidiomarina aquimaris]|uniref:CC0125/CC1285 family lipoprotein n=1 Tax=Pseudidiomarina aquimaris TaxID=641841 RepID=UPI003A9710B5